jgi:hypothetical protein
MLLFLAERVRIKGTLSILPLSKFRATEIAIQKVFSSATLLFLAEGIGTKKQGNTLLTIFVKIPSNRNIYFNSIPSCHFTLFR